MLVSSLTLAIVVGFASLTGAYEALGDQLSATPLPILNTSSVSSAASEAAAGTQINNAGPQASNLASTVSSAAPDPGMGQSDGGGGGSVPPVTSSPAAPSSSSASPSGPGISGDGAPSVAAQTSADDDDSSESSSSASGDGSGSASMPTYGGTMYTKKPGSSAAATSTSAGRASAGAEGVSYGGSTDPAGLGDASAQIDAGDVWVASGVGSEGSAASGGEGVASESDASKATVTADVPGVGAGVTVLVLLAGVVFVGRRLRA